jgi:hypothetical protein
MYKMLFWGFLIAVIFSNSGSNAGEPPPADLYRQLGTVAAMAEVCYGSEQIVAKVKAATSKYALQVPTYAMMAETLIKEYNEAYMYAGGHHTIWIISQQKYSRIFNCDLDNDVDLIRGLENQILQLQ